MSFCTSLNSSNRPGAAHKIPTIDSKKFLAFGAYWRIVMYMNTKTRTNVYLTDEQRNALTKLSDETGAPVAELVRRAIDLYLEKQKGKDRPDTAKLKE